MTLSIHHLTCERNQQILFKNLDFSVNSGELLQIQGPNGCGKTTLLRVLAGLREPTHGNVVWKDKSIKDWGYCYYEYLSYVGHHLAIKLELTPLENCSISYELAKNHCHSAKEALVSFGLAPFLHRPCYQLSAGQRRRVALARLLITDAPIWLLDEPLTAMDASAVSTLIDLIYKHLQRGGLAVVSTHQLLEAELLPKRILELKRSGEHDA